MKLTKWNWSEGSRYIKPLNSSLLIFVNSSRHNIYEMLISWLMFPLSILLLVIFWWGLQYLLICLTSVHSDILNNNDHFHKNSKICKTWVNKHVILEVCFSYPSCKLQYMYKHSSIDKTSDNCSRWFHTYTER